MNNHFIKILSLLLAIGLNWAGFSAVGETAAYYFDNEVSSNNLFAAGSLDFSLESDEDFSPEVVPEQESFKDFSVSNDGSLGFQYGVHAENFGGNLCGNLNLTANLDAGAPEYTGSLTGFSFVAGEYFSPEDWSFTATIDSSDPALENQSCSFDMVFDGNQAGGPGFFDQEIISNTITSGSWSEPEILGISPIIDSYVNEANPGSNDGAGHELKIRSKNSSNPAENKRTFIQFDFHFPGGTIINSADLRLYMKDAPSIERTYEARRVLAEWKERNPGPGDGIDWNNQPSANGITSTAPSGDNNPKWISWGVTPDIQGFVDGDYENYGWRLSDSVESEHTSYEAKFHSREREEEDKRPVLEINFTYPEITTDHPVINEVYYNVGSGEGNDPNNEWVEIYNPTDSAINITGWKICETVGCDIIPSTAPVPAHGFAVASGKSSTWEDYWVLPEGALTIDLFGERIGSNGLRDGGDRVILKNSSDAVIDAMSYGDDDSQLNPAVSSSEKGKSLARIIKGYDNDSAEDWIINATPNPGTNPSVNGVETLIFTSEGVEFEGSELASAENGENNDLPEGNDEEEIIIERERVVAQEETAVVAEENIEAPTLAEGEVGVPTPEGVGKVPTEENMTEENSQEIIEVVLNESESAVVEEMSIESAPAITGNDAEIPTESIGVDEPAIIEENSILPEDAGQPLDGSSGNSGDGDGNNDITQ